MGAGVAHPEMILEVGHDAEKLERGGVARAKPRREGLAALAAPSRNEAGSVFHDKRAELVRAGPNGHVEPRQPRRPSPIEKRSTYSGISNADRRRRAGAVRAHTRTSGAVHGRNATSPSRTPRFTVRWSSGRPRRTRAEP